MTKPQPRYDIFFKKIGTRPNRIVAYGVTPKGMFKALKKFYLTDRTHGILTIIRGRKHDNKT